MHEERNVEAHNHERGLYLSGSAGDLLPESPVKTKQNNKRPDLGPAFRFS